MSLKQCKLIVFDLDGTIWDPEMYELWGGGAPFKVDKQQEGKVVIDCKKTKVSLMGNTQEILSTLKRHMREIAWVSTCDEPDWAVECLSLFTTDDGEPLNRLVKPQSSLIYKANKREHFKRLHAFYKNIEYDEMIFFDNQMNNIKDVSSLGVKCVYCPRGLSPQVWREGQKIFPDLPDLSQ